MQFPWLYRLQRYEKLSKKPNKSEFFRAQVFSAKPKTQKKAVPQSGTAIFIFKL